MVVIVGNVLDEIKSDEQFRSLPYHDDEGILTIGYGLNLEEGITEIEASYLCQMRIVSAKQDLNKNIPIFMQLDEPRRAVLINMCYNLGIHRLLLFKKFLAALVKGDYKTAAAEMLDSKWAKQVGARAHRLALRMETGQWQ